MEHITSTVDNQAEKPNSGIYVIRIAYKNGNVEYPVKIECQKSNWQAQLDDAEKYYTNALANEGIVTVSFALTPEDLGVPNIADVPDWSEKKRNLLKYNEKDKTSQFLSKMAEYQLSTWLIKELERDLNVEDNEKIFRQLLELKFPNPEDQKKVLKALEIARAAHQGQTQKRPQDNEGLDNIPYFNHCVQVAVMALRSNLSLSGIQAAILHDVVEDTSVTTEDLQKQGIEAAALVTIDNVTKGKDEDRKAYLDRVSTNKEENTLWVKLFDRYHNLVRAFSIADPKYLDRYITETEAYFLPILRSKPQFTELGMKFLKILKELKTYRGKLG